MPISMLVRNNNVNVPSIRGMVLQMSAISERNFYGQIDRNEKWLDIQVTKGYNLVNNDALI